MLKEIPTVGNVVIYFIDITCYEYVVFVLKAVYPDYVGNHFNLKWLSDYEGLYCWNS